MARNYRKYTDEDIVIAAKETTNMCQMLARLNLRAAGGNFNSMRRAIQRLSLDCSHWTGSAWNKGKQLKDWSDYTKVESIKPHLIKEHGHKCEQCKNEQWQGVAIPLEVDHINGDKTDNQKQNLRLLCCNCHALTSTWRGRNVRV